MKKKLLLVGVAAMGLLAVGVGATSTFAWYTASAAVTLKNVSDVGYSMTTGISTASAEDVNITFTVAHKTGAPIVELSAVVSGNVQYGAMKNGLDKESSDWDGKNKTGHKLISEYDVTAVLGTATAGQKAYLNGKTYSFELESVGNAKILDFSSTIDIANKDDFANADAKTEAASPTVSITFGADGAIASYSISNPYYVVRTNNPDGMEALAADAFNSSLTTYKVGDEVTYSGNVYRFHTDKTAADWDPSKVTLLGAATLDFAAGNYEQGAVVKYDSKFYRCKADKTGSSNPSTETDYWVEVKLHSEDKIRVVASQSVDA